MKKVLLIFLMLSVLVFASCTNSNTANTSPSSNNSSQQTNTTNSASEKINVTVPDGWKAVEGSVLEHQYMKNTASFMIKKEAFSETTLDGVVAAAEGIFKQSFTNYKAVGTPQSIKVGGKDAKKIIFTCEVGKLKMKYMYVYLFVGNDTYAITFGDQQSTFDSLSADYQTILNAITIK
ncbi:MAG: hypothetical protein GYA50_08420 [Eubacteriaceae bacterium]|nr:hypothetical protein [Eubacteriaceae bacterium]